MPPFDQAGRCLRVRPEARQRTPQVDLLGACLGGRRQYVLIVRVGQRESLDQRFVAGDQAVPHRAVHQRARTTQAACIEIRDHVGPESGALVFTAPQGGPLFRSTVSRRIDAGERRWAEVGPPTSST